MTAKTMAAVLSEHLYDRGNDVRAWPDDEAAAYRDNGGFQEGRDAMRAIMFQKTADALTAAGFGLVADAKADAWDEGVQAGHDGMIGKFHKNPYRRPE